jgi:hypothetical protein
MTGGAAAFDDRARATFAGLADILIPAADGMPSASEAGAAGRWLDAVLVARPDLTEPLLAWPGGWTAGPGGRRGAPRRRPGRVRPADRGRRTPLPMNPAVRELVGCRGRSADPDQRPPDWLDLLEPVIERGRSTASPVGSRWSRRRAPADRSSRDLPAPRRVSRYLQERARAWVLTPELRAGLPQPASLSRPGDDPARRRAALLRRLGALAGRRPGPDEHEARPGQGS